MPELQRRQAKAQKRCQLTGSGTIGHTLIENNQVLMAIVRRRLSRLASPSSPPKACISFETISSAAAFASDFSMRRGYCLSRLIFLIMHTEPFKLLLLFQGEHVLSRWHPGMPAATSRPTPDTEPAPDSKR